MELETDYTMVVAGATGSGRWRDLRFILTRLSLYHGSRCTELLLGKTHFIAELCRNQESMHDKPFDRIILVYSILQPIYVQLQSEVPNLELSDGLPDDIAGKGRTLVILDDMMLELSDDRRLAELFTKMRHYNVSTIFVTQSLYFPSKYLRTVLRNSHYIVLFNSPRDQGIQNTLGRQVFPQWPKLIPDAFRQATKKPYGYLFLDLKPTTDPRYRVREGVLPGEQLFIYVPK